MTTFSSAARCTRRALTGLGIVAASMLVLVPAAGAERPETSTTAATASQSDTSQETPSTRSPARSSEPEAQRQVTSPGSEAAPEPSDSSGRYEHTLCHRTSAAADPYAQITVAFRTADGKVVSSDGGHAEGHDGPVFDPATMDDGDTWGDIIPPFTTPDGASYPGKNWPAGRAIFENGCEPAVEAVPPAPAVPEGDGTIEADPPPEERGAAAQGRDALDPADREPEPAASAPDQREPRSSASADPGGRRAAGAAATGDIAAVLGQQVTRDPDRGAVVPAADSEAVLPIGLARTDTGFAVALMLGLSVLIGGYVAVDALRERMRRTD